MKKPNHIIFDFNNKVKTNSSQYWALNFLEQKQKYPSFLNDLDIHKKFFVNKKFKKSSKFFTKKNKFSISFNGIETNSNFQSQNLLHLFTKPVKPENEDKKDSDKKDLVLKYSKNKAKKIFILSHFGEVKFYKRNIERLFYLTQVPEDGTNENDKPRESWYSTLNINFLRHNSWYSILNINFLRKERLYTKLKYSRSPAYDIVSGGAAALLAGLIGFLVSEKFGLELVDSGDFYYLFMYIVFLVFSIRPLLTITESGKSFWNLFSPNRIFVFYNQLILLFINFIKYFIKL